MAESSTKSGHSRGIIKRLFVLFGAMFFVFCASGIVTAAMRTPYPVDYMLSYVDDFKEYLTSDDNEKIEPEKTSKLKNFNPEKISDREETEIKFDAKNENVYPEEKSGNSKTPAKDFGIVERLSNMVSVEDTVNDAIKENRNYVMLEDMPQDLKRAIVSVEDSRFYSHDGFDLKSIARATVANVEAGEIEEGASTITQQLVKNLFLSPEQTFTRKFEELILAMNVERSFSKDKILEIYLNSIYFGSNFYGIYEAAEGYFGKEPKDLTTAESAMLAGLPNAPSVYSPYENFMLAKKRQLVVIDAMEKSGYLNGTEAENARIEEIVLVR